MIDAAVMGCARPVSHVEAAPSASVQHPFRAPATRRSPTVSEVKLVATARTEFGKGAARRIRRAHQVPAVLYGHGAAPVHITLPGHETMLALKQANALVSIDLDGEDHLAIAKDVQRDPVRDVIEHVDLLTVVRGEKIHVVVPVRVVGESAPGTIHFVETQSVQVEAEATHLPEVIEASVEGLEAGAAVRGSDLNLPEGVALLGDPDEVVVAVSVPQVTEEEAPETQEAPAAEVVEGAEAPQGDVVEEA